MGPVCSSVLLPLSFFWAPKEAGSEYLFRTLLNSLQGTLGMILHVAFHIIFLSIVRIIFHSVGSSCRLFLWALVIFGSPPPLHLLDARVFPLEFCLTSAQPLCLPRLTPASFPGANTLRHVLQSRGISVCPHRRHIGTPRSHPLHCDCRRHRSAKSQSQAPYSRHSRTNRADCCWGRSNTNEAEWTVGRHQEGVNNEPWLG